MTIPFAPRLPDVWIRRDGQPVPAFYRFLATLTQQVNTTNTGTPNYQFTTSEALSAGALFNIASTGLIRNANASIPGREAHGFVYAAVGSGQVCTGYFNGIITGFSGLTPPGYIYLSLTAGGITTTAPTQVGQTVQRVGQAISASVINFAPETSILL